LSSPRFLAAFAAALTLLVVSFTAQPAHAAVPNRLYGTVTLNGQPAPVGTTIVGLTGGKQCASATVSATAISGTSYPYIMNIPDGSADFDCKPGAVIVFTVGGVTAGQTVTLDDVGTFFRVDLTAPGTPNVPTTTRTVNLPAGCSEVTSSFANATTPQTIAQAIAPADALVSIWRFDATAGAHRGYSPATAFASDLTAVNRNDALRICTTAPATLTQPA
jgi:hypothetical protein